LKSRTVWVSENLFAQDVGVPCVLGELAKDLDVQGPHAALATSVDDIAQRERREGSS